MTATVLQDGRYVYPLLVSGSNMCGLHWEKMSGPSLGFSSG